MNPEITASEIIEKLREHPRFNRGQCLEAISPSIGKFLEIVTAEGLDSAVTLNGTFRIGSAFCHHLCDEKYMEELDEPYRGEDGIGPIRRGLRRLADTYDRFKNSPESPDDTPPAEFDEDALRRYRTGTLTYREVLTTHPDHLLPSPYDLFLWEGYDD